MKTRPYTRMLFACVLLALVTSTARAAIPGADDPKAFTQPWTVVRHYRRQPDWQIEEFVCENNRNAPDANGVTTFR